MRLKFDRLALRRRGKRIYYKTIPGAESVHLRIGFPIGGLDDPVGKEGLIHFLEHVVLNGSRSLCSPAAVREFDRRCMLGSKNGTTSSDFVYFSCRFLPEDAKQVLQKFFELVFRPLFLAIEDERKIILQELAQRRFGNKAILRKIRIELADQYGGHPLSRYSGAAGWIESVRAITEHDLRQWHDECLKGNGATVTLLGAVSRDILNIAADEMEKYTGDGCLARTDKVFDLPHCPATTVRLFGPSDVGMIELTQSKLHFVTYLPRQIPQAHLEVAVGLLRELLLRKWREKMSATYGVSVRWSNNGYRTIISISSSLDPRQTNAAVKYIRTAIQQVGDGTFHDLIQEQRLLEMLMWRASELSLSLTSNAIIEEFLSDGGLKSMSERAAMLEDTTPDHVESLFRQFMGPENTYLQLQTPTGKLQ